MTELHFTRGVIQKPCLQTFQLAQISAQNYHFTFLEEVQSVTLEKISPTIITDDFDHQTNHQESWKNATQNAIHTVKSLWLYFFFY